MLCDDCQNLCKDDATYATMMTCSKFKPKITKTEVDYMVRRLLKYYHIPETDEQVKITMRTLKKQAEYVKARDKILSFLDKFKVNYHEEKN